MSPDWQAWETTSAALPPIEKAWLEELFTWEARPYPPGEWLVFNLRHAAALALLEDAAEAARWLARAETNPAFIGFAHGHVATMLELGRQIVARGATPERAHAFPNELEEWTLWKYKPLPESEQVGPADVAAVVELVEGVADQSPEDWLASREAAAAAVRADVANGRLKLDRVPELAAQALRARAEVRTVEARDAAARAELAERLAAAEARRDRAAAALDQGGRESLEGIGSEIKRAAKRLESKARKLARDPVMRLRDELAEALLPAVVRRWGRSLDDEVHRLARRINAEFERGLLRLEPYAGFLRAISLAFDIVLPGIGRLVDVLVVAVIAGVEIAAADIRKRELGQDLKRFRAAVESEIQRLNEEAEALEAEARRLEAARLEQLRLADSERARREQEAAAFAAELARRHEEAARRDALIGAAGALLSLLGLWWSVKDKG